MKEVALYFRVHVVQSDHRKLNWMQGDQIGRISEHLGNSLLWAFFLDKMQKRPKPWATFNTGNLVLI
jgi:hypothetical protein